MTSVARPLTLTPSTTRAQPHTTPDPFPRVAAAVGGLGLLLMTGLAGWSVRTLETATTADTSVAVLAATPWQAVLLCLAAVIVLDVVVALAIARVLAPRPGMGAKRLAIGAAALRVVYAGLFAWALVALLPLPGLTDDVAASRAAAAAFHAVWDPALGVFGVSLVTVGLGVWRLAKSGHAPRWLAVAVVVAGLGYTVDGVAKLFGVSANVAIVVFWGELLLMGWLLARAVRRSGGGRSGADRG